MQPRYQRTGNRRNRTPRLPAGPVAAGMTRPITLTRPAAVPNTARARCGSAAAAATGCPASLSAATETGLRD